MPHNSGAGKAVCAVSGEFFEWDLPPAAVLDADNHLVGYTYTYRAYQNLWNT